MPKLKQPLPLLDMATGVLIDLLANYCHKCSIEGSLDKLHQHVAFMKDDIGPYIPWQMAAGFYEDLLQQFLHDYQLIEERPESHKMAMFEVLMDRKLVGLKCPDLELMDMKDAHRIHGLQELKMSSRRYDLGTFHLEDLTELVYHEYCTDSDLEIIGRNCSKLGFLDVTDSRSDGITDNGLLALRSCPQLRDVRVIDCQKITDEGIKKFLAVHGKIQTLYSQFLSHEADFDGFAHVGWSVYPSMKELAIAVEHTRVRDLRCITEKFPNLISLAIYGELDDAADLSTLASLDKLSKLELWGCCEWDNLNPLLISIGANITVLEASFFCSQSNLDFLYKFCPNIENLHCSHRTEANEEILVVPPFKRLRAFGIGVSDEDDRLFAGLQFGVMSKLDKLRLYRCRVTTEYIASMILDNNRFPNLTALRLSGMSRDQYDINRIKEIVKNNNLDLDIRYS